MHRGSSWPENWIFFIIFGHSRLDRRPDPSVSPRRSRQVLTVGTPVLRRRDVNGVADDPDSGRCSRARRSFTGHRSGEVEENSGDGQARQRPSTAKGITFVTLEDETGYAYLSVRQRIWESCRRIAREAAGHCFLVGRTLLCFVVELHNRRSMTNFSAERMVREIE